MKIVLMITLFLINAVLNLVSLEAKHVVETEQAPTEVSQRYIESFNEKQTDATKE